MSSSRSLSLIPRARAVGPDGEVICTDGDPEIARLAEDYLSTAGMGIGCATGSGMRFMGSRRKRATSTWCIAMSTRNGYPNCWHAARDRIRVGGMWLCDNTIWSGYVATATDKEGKVR